MNSFDMNDNIRFVLPDEYIHETGVNDDGVLMTAIRADETMDDEGNVSYGFDARARLFEHDPNDFEKGFSADRLLDASMENLETARYITISRNPAANLINKKLSLSVFGIELHFNSIMCVIQADEWDVISLTVSKKNTGDPDDLICAVKRLIEVAKSIRIKGKPIPFESFDVASAVDALDYDDDLIDGIEDVTSEVIREARSTSSVKSFKAAKPNDSLYPHYKQLKGKTGPIAPGITMITNATGTEYEFIPLSRAIDNDELPEDERAAYRRVIEKDTAAYDLADCVPEMQRLFHVNVSVFNQKRDRECEIDQGLLHRAYMMSALRSFAWTLAEYCESNSTKPDNISVSKLKEIVAFCAKKEWLNYRGDSYCNGLCGCSDLHVFYIPDAVSNADRKKLLPSDELVAETERRKAALPYYNPILDEVHSLDALRKDLTYIYPAIHTLCDSLAQNRNYDEALTGNEADIVYAWCSLAKAAKEPFYVEDGPMHCYFTQMKNEEETAAEREAQRIQWEAEREEYAKQHEEEWLKQYGDAVEKNPDIQFDGKLFVFSGVDSDEIVDAVLKKGGQERSKISGITNYLVVDPRYCGESKTYNAIEQQKKGKPVKIILLDDLKAVLEGKKPLSVAKIDQKTSQNASAGAAKKTKTSGKKTDGNVSSSKDGYRKINDLISCDNSDSNRLLVGNQWLFRLPDGISATYDTEFSATLNGSPEKVPMVLRGLKQREGWFLFDFALSKHFNLTGQGYTVNDCRYDSRFLESEQEHTDQRYGLNVVTAQRKIIYDSDELYVDMVNEDMFPFANCIQIVMRVRGNGIDPMNFESCVKKDRLNQEVFSEISAVLHKIAESICLKNTSSAEKAPTVKKNEAQKDSRCIMNGTVLEKYIGTEQDVVLPEGITELADSIFSGRTNLRSIVIPESVKRIGYRAFENCYSLERAALPTDLEYLDGYCFVDCHKLRYINLGSKLKTIGGSTFSECYEMCNVSVSKHINSIDAFAFKNCKGITEFIIPDGVERIGFSAFAYCKNLEYLFIPASVNVIQENPINEFLFIGCDKLTIHTPAGSYAERYARSHNIPVVTESLPSRKITGKTRAEVLANTVGTKNNCDQRSYSANTSKPNRIPANFPKGIRVYPGDDLEVFAGTVTEYNGTERDIILPAGISEIGADVFQFSSLRSIVIPEGVTEIGKDAFYNCEELTHVALPNSLKEIGEQAFHGCSKLQSIDFPDGLSEIGETAFYKSGLTEVHIPESCTIIRESAFQKCSELKKVFIHDDVEEIEPFAFSDCPKLREIYVPLGTKIGSLAFDEDCTIQTSKNISVNELSAVKILPADFPKGKRIYAGDDLEIVNGIVTGYTGDETDIILPAGITAIGEDAFQFTSLQSVVIPEGVTEIGKDAFYSCDELTHISLPNSLKKLGNSVFYGCKELKNVDLPDGLTDIGDSAFRESGLEEIRIPSSCTVIQGWTFNECSELSRVILHENIKRIGQFAFESCPELKGIVVPQKTIIEKYAFDDEAYVEREKNASNRKTSEANNTYAKVPTASEFSVTRTGILNKYTGKTKSHLELPKGIKRIGANVFAYHFELESVIIPEGVTRIDKEAFVGSNLKTVSFPNTLQSIGEKAFWGTNLESVSLPESLQTIEGYAFSNCRELRQVTFKGNSCTTLGWCVFSDCSALRDIYLPEGITKIGYAVLNKSGIVSASVPSTVKVLESRMFDECEKLKEVIFRGKVESIGYRMFGKCKALEMIVIPEGTKSIQKNAFLESKQLKDVFIPLSVESIALDDNDAGKRTVFHVVKGSNAEKFCIEHQRKYDNLSYEEVIEKRKTEQIYADAKGLMEKGEFAAAKEKYAMIPDYIDAAKQAKICESKAEEQRIERLYTEAKQLMEAENYVAAKDRFLEIAEYQDSEPLAKQCEEKEQIRRSELAYQQLIGKKQTAKTVGDWTALGNWFKQMNDYKDSQIQAKLCADKATELQRQIDEERQKELARRAIEERRKALEAEMKEQEAIIQKNKGIGALFGEKAKNRKAAQNRLSEIKEELSKLGYQQ